MNIKTEIIKVYRELMAYSLRKRVFIAIAAFFVLLNAAILLYPADKFLPLARIGNNSVAGQSSDQANTTLQNSLNDQKVQLLYNGQEITVSQQDLGIFYDNQATQDALTKQRRGFVPLLWLFTGSSNLPSPQLNEDKLLSSLRQIEQDYLKIATGGELKVDSATGEVTVLQRQDGVELDTGKAFDKIRAQILESPMAIELPLNITPAGQQTTGLQEVKSQIEAFLVSGTTITINDDLLTPTRQELVEWLVIKYDDAQAAVQLDNDKLTAYFKSYTDAINKDATTARATVVDGVQTGLVAGTDGKQLDVAAMIADLGQVLVSSTANRQIIGYTRILAAPVSITKSYSNTSAGLLAKIKDWEAKNYGTYGISVVELSGSASLQSANFNATKSFVTASLYKMFVAYIVLQDVDNGVYSFGSTVSNGLSVEAALQDAIVYSGNVSAIALAQKAGGWAAIDARISAAGFNSTRLNNYDQNGVINSDKYSTTADQSLLLQRLYNGSLVSATSSAKFINWMKAQIYRQGIPAGSSNAVANKVGFLDDYLHDAAIVYTAKGDYAVVVMSNNSSWTKIADLATLINAHLSQ